MRDEDRFKSRCDYDLFVSEIASVLHVDDETVSPSSLKQKVTFIFCTYFSGVRYQGRDYNRQNPIDGRTKDRTPLKDRITFYGLGLGTWTDTFQQDPTTTAKVESLSNDDDSDIVMIDKNICLKIWGWPLTHPTVTLAFRRRI